MPELPEVETTRRGIEPHLLGQQIRALRVRESRLRWPVPSELTALEGATVTAVRRRAKYLLIDVPSGSAIVHLGMSGSLRIATETDNPRKHDHVDLVTDTGTCLRYHDPRRFGCWLWQPANATHQLLADLGPEPLGDAFTGEYLFQATRKRKVPIKVLIMNAQVVVGVGNIYASESLFMAGIRPGRAAARISRNDAERLVTSIKTILARSIKQGGTTLRDFVGSDGTPGYFAQQLLVYGRAKQACRHCAHPISQRVIGQRSTFWCSHCQR